MLMVALGVIGESLDDRTIAGIDATNAGSRNSFEFAFELAQADDLVTEVCEVTNGDYDELRYCTYPVCLKI